MTLDEKRKIARSWINDMDEDALDSILEEFCGIERPKPEVTTRYHIKLSKEEIKYLVTVEGFLEDVENGSIMDEDGCGYWVKDGKRSNSDVFSTDQEDATHVIWYNK